MNFCLYYLFPNNLTMFLLIGHARHRAGREAAMCTVSMVFLLEERVTSMTRAGKWWMRRVHAYVWGGHRALPPGL